MKALLIIAASAIGLTSCQTPDPVVVTDIDNRIIDMPAGVRWDIIMSSPDWVEVCNDMGGEPIMLVDHSTICEGIDY